MTQTQVQTQTSYTWAQMQTKAQIRYPSEKQYRFVADMLGNRDWSSLSDKYRARLDELVTVVAEFVAALDDGRWSDYTVAAADGPLVLEQTRALIDTLVPLPRKKSANVSKTVSVLAKDFPTVFGGRYAVPTDAGHLAFYKVNVPDIKSVYHGRIFVDVMASSERHPVRGSAARAVLRKIAVDPISASKRYGQEIGSCGMCNKVLTDERSRAFGLGPKCRAKVGL